MPGPNGKPTAMEFLMELQKRVAALEEWKASVVAAFAGTAPGGAPKVATDRELDSKYGDEELKYDPRGWDGPSYVGNRMSETDVEYLLFLAEGNEDYAHYLLTGPKRDDPKSKKSAGYRYKSARLARGWAKRLEDGWTPKTPRREQSQEQTENPFRKPVPAAQEPPQLAPDDDEDDSIPF